MHTCVPTCAHTIVYLYIQYLHAYVDAYIFSLQEFVFQAARCGASVQSSVVLQVCEWLCKALLSLAVRSVSRYNGDHRVCCRSGAGKAEPGVSVTPPPPRRLLCWFFLKIKKMLSQIIQNYKLKYKFIWKKCAMFKLTFCNFLFRVDVLHFASPYSTFLSVCVGI